jgi:thiol-disulfide isomerase/thioredoxin
MRWCAVLLSMGLCALPALPQTPMVFSGTVSDQEGNLLAGVDLAQFWLAGSRDPGGFRAYDASKTDGHGAFELKVGKPHFPATLFAMDAQRQRGTIITIQDASAASGVIVRLQPLHRVQYHFQAPGVTDLSKSRITLARVSSPVFSQIVGAPEGAISLPPGSYAIAISTAGGGQEQVNFEISDRDVTLDTIALHGDISQYYGHAAPPLTEVQPVNADSFVAGKLHGKWTLVYFWGYWCAPCVNEGLPKLAQFYKKNRNRLGEFEILAIHENGVDGTITLEELRQKLAALAKDKWSGEGLPFPVLLDRSGDTIKSWGISGYPTVALISPNGELTEGGLEALQRALDRK